MPHDPGYLIDVHRFVYLLLSCFVSWLTIMLRVSMLSGDLGAASSRRLLPWLTSDRQILPLHSPLVNDNATTVINRKVDK